MIAESGATVTCGLRYGPHDRQCYDVYEPSRSQDYALAAEQDLPTVHFIYGGSWRTGERGCYHYVGTALARRGIRTVIADYRLYPDVAFPGFVDDMALAYGHIASRFGGTGRTLVLAGHSAGAHIAGLLMGDPRYLKRHAPSESHRSGFIAPSGFIGLCGPYAFDPTTWPTTADIFQAAAGNPDVARPIAFVRPSLAPSLLLHGKRDSIVTPDASRLFHDALAKAGVHSELKLYDYLGHAGTILAIARPLRWTGSVLNDMVGFITRLHRQPAGPQDRCTGL